MYCPKCGKIHSYEDTFKNLDQYLKNHFSYDIMNSWNNLKTIANNVKRIPAYLFNPYNNSTSYIPYVKTVVIGNSVTDIGNNAFYQCSGLTSVVIPNSVTSIGRSAFHQCNLPPYFRSIHE